MPDTPVKPPSKRPADRTPSNGRERKQHISSKSPLDTKNDDNVIEKEIISDKTIVDQNENNIQSTHINVTTDKVYPEKLDSQ